MLQDLLTAKKCFKLVCGAGNQDIDEVEKLVALYAKAGANFFDLSADQEIVKAAKRGLRKVIPQDELKNYHICVSIGVTGDPHIRKAVVNQDKCNSCEKCFEVCPQNAIFYTSDNPVIDEKRCIGCGNCKKACTLKAISYQYKQQTPEDVLAPLLDLGIDCVEFHISGEDELEIREKWGQLNKVYKGLLSICINRSHLGDKKLIERLKYLLSFRTEYSTIIQTDGVPMSGHSDDYKSSLQTLALAEVIQNHKLPAFIMLSGGTNSKTTELSKLFSLNINGVAIGSYARKIVKDYICKDDFLENKEIFNKALALATKLVEKSLKYM